MKDKIDLLSIKNMNKIDSLVIRNNIDGLEVLGAAMGSVVFVSSCLLKRLRNIEELLQLLAYMNDPQCTYFPKNKTVIGIQSF